MTDRIEHSKRRERLRKAIDKRAKELELTLRHPLSIDMARQLIAEALYDEACRAESRVRAWRKKDKE